MCEPLGQSQPLIVDIPTACRLLSMSRAKLYRKIRAKELVACRDGGNIRIKYSEIERYADALAAVPPTSV